MAHQHIINHLSGNICSKCGGEAPGWRCPACGLGSKAFDPLHWRNCRSGGKMQAECQRCSKAESQCTCASPLG